MIKKVVLTIFVLLAVCTFALSQEINIKTTADWTRALSSIAKGGNNKSYTLVINGNIGIPGGLGEKVFDFDSNYTFGAVENLTITLCGNGKLFLTSTGEMFHLCDGQTLIIDSERFTLQGLTKGQNGASENNNSSIIRMAGGNLFLKNGTISGNTVEYYEGGGGVFVGAGGNFIMTGGAISGNTSSTGSGGGVFVNSGGSFNMTDGTIIGNVSSGKFWQKGGGVYVQYGNFVKTGGIIYGNNTNASNKNTASFGSAVYYVDSDAYDGNYFYYCDNTLDSTNKGNIKTTDVLPSRNGQSVGNWNRRASR